MARRRNALEVGTMNLREVTSGLRELAEELYKHGEDDWANRVVEYADEIPRRTKVTRAPTTSKKMTIKLRKDIKRMHALFPEKSQRWIGQQIGVDQGRVSETLAGFRT